MDNFKFSQLKENDLNEAYSIIEERFSFLEGKGIHQYPFPYPTKEDFIKQQRDGINFCLKEDNSLFGIVTLTENVVRGEWNYRIFNRSLRISAFYTNIKVRGGGFGKILIENIEKYALQNSFDQLLLDCYTETGFLEGYYEDIGFKTQEKMVLSYPPRTFECALMVKELNRERRK